MNRYIYGEDDRIHKWVAQRTGAGSYGNGVHVRAIGHEIDGELVAGVVYDSYTGPNIVMHVAGEPRRRWLTEEFLFRVFAFPFIQLGCTHVSAFPDANNVAACRLDEKVGFFKEGVMRQAAKDGGDVVMYGMLKDECRWIKYRKHRRDARAN